MMNACTSFAWETVQEMHAGGCPLDVQHLYRRFAPLRVRALPFDGLAPIHALKNGFALWGSIELEAHCAVTVVDYHLHADWLPGAVELARPSQHHRGYYSVPGGLRVAGKNAFAHQLRQLNGRLKQGTRIKGILLGLCQGQMPDRAAIGTMPVALTLQDADGYRYRFGLSLTTPSSIVRQE